MSKKSENDTNEEKKQGKKPGCFSRLIKVLLIAVVIIAVLVFVFGTGGGGFDAQVKDASGKVYMPNLASTGNTTWTIMVYCCGADLESNYGEASKDLMEIANAVSSSNIRVVAQTGGAAQWQVDGISSDRLQRYVLANGELTRVHEQENASMGDPNTLADFISWTSEYYTSDRYMIVFWNHGSGAVYGTCFDENYDDDSLSSKELGIAMKNDIIGFDTCLSACIEIDKAIAPYGKYVVSSEEVEPGDGWNYKDFIAFMCSNPDSTTTAIGTHIVDSYLDLCKENDTDEKVTLSLVDLSKINGIYKAFEQMSIGMTALTEDVYTFREVTRKANRSLYFGPKTESEGYANMIDLGDLARNNEGNVEGSANLLSLIQDAVVYEKHGRARDKATGISVFYPVKSSSDELDRFAEATNNRPYLSFIDSVCDYWQAPNWVYEWSEAEDSDNTAAYTYTPVTSEAFPVKFEEGVSEDEVYYIKVNSGLDAVDYVNFDLFYIDDDSEYLYYLGSDNDLNADWDTGLFSDNFAGTWITIEGYLANVNLIEENEYYNLYSVPIRLNGKDMNLHIIYDYETAAYSVEGVHSGLDTSGAASRKVYQLKQGDQITFLFPTYDLESNETEELEAEGETITYSGSLEIDDGFLFDGNYYYIYTVVDIFGNDYDTEGVFMQIDNNEIHVSME